MDIKNGNGNGSAARNHNDHKFMYINEKQIKDEKLSKHSFFI